ncbi:MULTISPECIES: PA1414 family protein [Pseudomonas]|nr:MULTISPECIES: PA1414 family protein [Pseudomonas]
MNHHTFTWKLGIVLGLIQAPRLQPIRIETDEYRRKLAARRRRR